MVHHENVYLVHFLYVSNDHKLKIQFYLDHHFYFYFLHFILLENVNDNHQNNFNNNYHLLV